MAVETQGDDPLVDESDLEETGYGTAEGIADWWPTIPVDATAEEATNLIEQALQAAEPTLAPPVYDFVQSVSDAMTDAINDGIVPPSQSGSFWLWLMGAGGLSLIAAGSAYAITQGKIVQWAQSMGWATLVGPPAPTPAVQAFIGSRDTASPLPSVPVPAPVLPSPSLGQQAVVSGATTIKPSTVTGGLSEGTSADQVSAALAVTAVDVLRVVAHVFDDMLPNMAPGQVPEALTQLNTAVNALENQLQQVRNGQWPRGFKGVQEALNGGLEALNGLEQEVNTLALDVAEKASSALGDHVNSNTSAIAGVSSIVAGITGTAIPELAGSVQTLTSTVGALDSQVTNEIAPALSAVEAEAAQSTKMLSGTDQDCLDELCDDQGNVIRPIKDGGATPSLLGKLGSLLGLGWALGSLFGLMDVIETLFDAPLALQAVAQDVELLSGWASSAAKAIEADLPFAPTS